MTKPIDTTPGWMKTMQEKNANQIRSHEARFGKLGEPQSPEEKSALAQAVSEIKKEQKSARSSNN